MICDGCVFIGKVVERNQSACGFVDGQVEAIKACVAAHVSGRCEHRMTRKDVQEYIGKVEKLEAERDRARELLECVSRVISGMLDDHTEENHYEQKG